MVRVGLLGAKGSCSSALSPSWRWWSDGSFCERWVEGVWGGYKHRGQQMGQSQRSICPPSLDFIRKNTNQHHSVTTDTHNTTIHRSYTTLKYLEVIWWAPSCSSESDSVTGVSSSSSSSSLWRWGSCTEGWKVSGQDGGRDEAKHMRSKHMEWRQCRRSKEWRLRPGRCLTMKLRAGKPSEQQRNRFHRSEVQPGTRRRRRQTRMTKRLWHVCWVWAGEAEKPDSGVQTLC